MDILWYGQAAFKLKGKTTTVVIDPFNPEMMNLKLPKDLSADIVLQTHDHPDHSFVSAVGGEPVVLTGPGEYEIKGVAIVGVGTYHDDKKGEERGRNTVYNIDVDGINIVHLGDLGHLLTDAQVEEIGDTDILLIPVGGKYTIDAKTASQVVASLEPRIIIPMHYALPGLKIELDGVEPFLKEMGAENKEPQPKLSITKDKLPEEPEVVVLSKS